MMRATKRSQYKAQAVPVGHSHRRGRRWLGAPVAAALLLSTLALAAPALTQAPQATRTERLGPRLIDELPIVAVTPVAVAAYDERTAGPFAPLPELDPVVGARYQAAVDAARAEAGAHGITFAMVRDGELLWSGSSGQGRDGSTPLMPDSSLVIGSVTKTFVSATVLQLAADGLIELDDPVGDYLSEARAMTGTVTVAQLLDHTSGLADLFNDTTRLGLEEHPERAWSAAEILATLHEPWYEPGEGWAYANTNYYLLGMLVEHVTGHPLAEELDRRFLAPYGLTATRVLTGADGEALRPAWATIFWASGAMVSSAADLARWGDALYAGRVLDPAARAAMLRLNGHDHGYGVQKLEFDDVVGYGHTGLLDTYTTLLFHIPADEVTVALLVNRSHVDLGAMLTAEPDDGPSLLELATGSTD